MRWHRNWPSGLFLWATSCCWRRRTSSIRNLSYHLRRRNYRERLAAGEAADRVADRAEEKAQAAHTDRLEKGKPYEADTLFSYLWGRGFGTSAYAGAGFARLLDRWVARVADYEPLRRDYWLLKPATYMNESGRCVGAFLRFHRIEAAQMLVVHDELDLPPGAVKLKFGGGTGGHNGLRDIDEVLGTRDFWRLRIGIGHPGHKDRVADYVLHEARREEQEAIDPPFDRSLGLLSRIATGRMTDATTWLHTIPKPEIEIPVDTGKPVPKKYEK